MSDLNKLHVRACSPNEIDSWCEFLNRNFGYQAPDSYIVDFAPLFTENALARSRLAFDGSRIVSSATLYPVTAIIKGIEVRLGVIGAVATDETNRGLGHSTKIIEELENTARADGLQGLLLWSDQTAFYDKLGFRPVGRQEVYSLAGMQTPTHLSDEILNGTAAYDWDWQVVRTLYERHACRVKRSDAYWQELKNISSCTRLQWFDDKGRVRAYLGFDRGKDLRGIIHEWGGDDEALTALVWVVLQNRPELLWLTHPALPDPIRGLLPADARIMQSSLGLFKTLNAAELSVGNLRDVWFWGLDSL